MSNKHNFVLPLFLPFVIFNFTPLVPVSGFDIFEDSISMFVDDFYELSYNVTPYYASLLNVVWESSDNSIATVENGIINSVGYGKVTITGTTEDGSFSDVCVVTVLPKDPIIIIGCKNVLLNSIESINQSERYGVVAINSNLHIKNCTISGKMAAVHSNTRSKVTSDNNSGINNSIVIKAINGGLVYMVGSQPSGETEKETKNGGHIF